ncbi:30S ribosomal protein S4 [Myxococcota bacterium]|nr:30S ribosomal protein S4 [Myxococcota bacterium]
MARYTGPVCRFCRREGMKLFLKADRCYTDKCAFERTSYPPGQHGQARPRFSEYGQQLREKQKVKRIYGLLERQFRLYFHKAERQRGVTGENLLRLLEQRLDNVVFRLGFAGTRAEARQVVHHGHIHVNGRRVNVPSYQVRAGDVIEVQEKSRKVQRIVDSLAQAQSRPMMSWLEVDKAAFRGTIAGVPVRSEMTLPIQEQLIVELYSR